MSPSIRTTPRSSTSACTEVKTELLSYKWVIKKFKFLSQKNGKILSPVFRTINNDIEWKLSVDPRSNMTEDTNYISLGLYLYDHKGLTIDIEVQVKFSILPIGVSRTWVHRYETREGWGFPKMIRRSDLLKSCASDDTVTICCEIEIPRKVITEAIHTTECVEQAFDSSGGQLSQDFRSLFKELKLSDVTIFVGTQQFQAHKVVLAARSPVFSAMFENRETQENLKNEVKIEEMEPAVVEAMLEFFYTDEVTNLEVLACGLLAAADKYDVQRLRNMCEKVLYKTLNKENAIDRLIHADLYRSYKLKDNVMEFIDNHLLDVMDSDSYKTMKDPELLKELLQSVAIRKESKMIAGKPSGGSLSLKKILIKLGLTKVRRTSNGTIIKGRENGLTSSILSKER